MSVATSSSERAAGNREGQSTQGEKQPQSESAEWTTLPRLRSATGNGRPRGTGRGATLTVRRARR